MANCKHFLLRTLGVPENLADAWPKRAWRCRAVTGRISLIDQEAAWTFLKWLADREQTAKWYMLTGYVPVRKSVLESQVLLDFYEEDPNARVALDQLATARTRAMHPSLPEVYEALANAFETVALTNTTPQQALDEAVRVSTQAIEMYNFQNPE